MFAFGRFPTALPPEASARAFASFFQASALGAGAPERNSFSPLDRKPCRLQTSISAGRASKHYARYRVPGAGCPARAGITDWTVAGVGHSGSSGLLAPLLCHQAPQPEPRAAAGAVTGRSPPNATSGATQLPVWRGSKRRGDLDSHWISEHSSTRYTGDATGDVSWMAAA